MEGPFPHVSMHPSKGYRATKNGAGHTMQPRYPMVVLSIAAAAVIASCNAMPPAAGADGWGLNGTYTATSNGEWAKSNDIFHNETSLRSTWTISTTCSYPTECTGTVTSTWGWTAPIYQTGGVWFVKHPVDNWQPCPDGTTWPGLQVFRFAPTNPDGDTVDPTSSVLTGADETTGTSGACGRSNTLFISMPFKLVKNG